MSSHDWPHNRIILVIRRLPPHHGGLHISKELDNRYRIRRDAMNGISVSDCQGGDAGTDLSLVAQYINDQKLRKENPLLLFIPFSVKFSVHSYPNCYHTICNWYIIRTLNVHSVFSLRGTNLCCQDRQNLYLLPYVL